MTVINNQANLRQPSNSRKRRCQHVDVTQNSKRGRYMDIPQEQYINYPCYGFTTPKSRQFYVNQTPFTPTQDSAVKQLFTEHPIISSTPKRNKPETIWRPWLTTLPAFQSTVAAMPVDCVGHGSDKHYTQTASQLVPRGHDNMTCRVNHINRSPIGFYENYFNEHQKKIEKKSKVTKSRTAVQVPTGFQHFKQPVK